MLYENLREKIWTKIQNVIRRDRGCGVAAKPLVGFAKSALMREKKKFMSWRLQRCLKEWVRVPQRSLTSK